MIAVTFVTIYNWWQCWQSNGIEGLSNRSNSGWPSKADAAYIALQKHPLSVCYPTQRLIFVLDNASYHRNRAAKAAINLFQDRLQIIWLPKCCPYLKCFERFWLQLKNQAAVDQRHLDMLTLGTVITQALDSQNISGHSDWMGLKEHFHLVA